jgi:elongation factor Ts
MIEKIAMGRIGKFYKEVCLLKQEYIQDGKMTVAEYLKSVDKELTVTAFKRFTLRAE